MVLDNENQACQGVEGDWTTRRVAYAHDMTVAFATSTAEFRCTPSLQTGAYEVFVHTVNPAIFGLDDMVVEIAHAEGSDSESLTQLTGRWQSVGQYAFTAGAGHRVSLSPAWWDDIYADAMLFEYVGDTLVEPVVPSSIIADAAVSASSVYSSDFGVVSLKDGDSSTYWASQQVISDSTAWVKIEWDEERTVTEMTIDWRDDYYAEDFKIYAEIDGEWQAETSLRSGNSDTNEVSLNAKTNQLYVSLQNPAGSFFGIVDIDVQAYPPGWVEPNTSFSPEVTITSPAADSSFGLGQTVTLSASATDAEDGSLSSTIEWYSDHDGYLGCGASVQASDLSAAEHSISAKVRDSWGHSRSATVSVTVREQNNDAPTVTIENPLDGASFRQGSVVTFSAAASDGEDGDLTASITWTSSRDGELGTGAPVSTSSLSVGEHTITASVTDSQGSSSSTSIGISVTESPAQDNLAASAEASASSTYSADFSAAQLNDGDAGTMWASRQVNTSDTVWVELDWGSPHHLFELVIDWAASYGAQELVVYALVDGNWQAQTGVVAGASGEQTVALDVTTTRIYVSLRKPIGSFFGIQELIVY